ncbi:MAG: hypothetical protein JWP10_658 [Nocardioidaceae bacterium]|nr:hypothetical protein [Nocardioidaceae bacterium]
MTNPPHADLGNQPTRPSTRSLVRAGARCCGRHRSLAHPAVAAPDDAATKVVLVSAHLLAAAIIIPPLSQWLISASAER